MPTKTSAAPITAEYLKSNYTDLAHELGMSPNSLYRYFVDGSRTPSLAAACKIADHLGITLDELRNLLPAIWEDKPQIVAVA